MYRCIVVVALLGMASRADPAAQEPGDDRWCESSVWEDDHVAHQEREMRLPADRETVRVDAGLNGGVRVRGWDEDAILVRACVQARAASEARAAALLQEVRIVTGATIEPDGPHGLGRREKWWVSFEVFVPRRSNLDVTTHNGGIGVDGVAGTITFRATNGGVRLARVGGDVRGATTNGGLHVELDGTRWEGAGLDVRTTNGGVRLAVPQGYNAELETGTVNGRLDLDFPVTVRGRFGRTLSTTLGEGGAPIRVTTTNGSVRVRRESI